MASPVILLLLKAAGFSLFYVTATYSTVLWNVVIGGNGARGGDSTGANVEHVTDAGLVHLQGVTRLIILSVDGTKVTGAAVGRLKEALAKRKGPWQ